MAIVKDWNTRKINMIRKLHKKEAVFGYYHFGFVDEVKHVYENDTILDAWLYEEATRISRALQHILKPENMMIVSDHGFQKYHTLFGVLFVAGKDISIKKLPYDQKTINIVQSGQVSDTHIRPDNTLYNVEDIAPTILGLYGVDIPKMDGKLLHNIYIMRKITTEEKSEVEKQLKDMGYIK